MRKIITKREMEKRGKRKQFVVGIILVAIMVFSILGFAFFNVERTTTRKVKYNDFTFLLDEQGLWRTVVDGNDFSFRYLPNETLDIDVPFLGFRNYVNKPLYFVSENFEATSEIARNIQRFTLRMQEACLIGKNCTGNLPEKNCTNRENIIIIGISNSTEILQDENCVFILGQNSELTRISDAFLYGILGIRKF